jgi:hypothetical protein
MEDQMAKFSTLELSEKIQEALPENKKLQIILEGDAATFSGLATQYDGISAQQLADLVVEIGQPKIDLTVEPELPVDLILMTAKTDPEDVAVAVRNTLDTSSKNWFSQATSFTWAELIEDFEPNEYNYEFITK